MCELPVRAQLVGDLSEVGVLVQVVVGRQHDEQRQVEPRVQHYVVHAPRAVRAQVTCRATYLFAKEMIVYISIIAIFSIQ